MTTQNPIIPTNGLNLDLQSLAAEIRNPNSFRLLSVNPKGSAEVAYIWRRVALEVSPKEALQRAITKVFTKNLDSQTIATLDTKAKAIIKATKAGIKAQAKVAKMQEAEPVVTIIEDEIPAYEVNENHYYGMGLCVEHQTCHHYFNINEPAKGSETSKGICHHCGMVRKFFNSIHSQIAARRKALKEALQGFDEVSEDSEAMTELAMQDALNSMAEFDAMTATV